MKLGPTEAYNDNKLRIDGAKRSPEDQASIAETRKNEQSNRVFDRAVMKYSNTVKCGKYSQEDRRNGTVPEHVVHIHGRVFQILPTRNSNSTPLLPPLHFG